MTSSRSELTFKHNRDLARHGWLRLTPAYSARAVADLLARSPGTRLALDPFSGSGTTALVCAEHGITCHVAEINPFLVWLGRAKTRSYTRADLAESRALACAAVARARETNGSAPPWVPPLANIERWWPPERLAALARLFQPLRAWRDGEGASSALDLSLIAFCAVALAWSSAAFNHQSMSFKALPAGPDDKALPAGPDGHAGRIHDDFLALVERMADEARSPLPGKAIVYPGDARAIDRIVPGPYDLVITSPPYPNRISYVRELRPHMYWLGYLNEARDAADLDWAAIGGTWGVATSRLAHWRHDGAPIPYDGFDNLIARIDARGPLLANYVYKYFADMQAHLSALRAVLAPGARVHYVVGNSKFYDVLVPVEEIYASMFRALGFRHVAIEVLRKRNSKKELFEYAVSATWPSVGAYRHTPTYRIRPV